MLFGHLPTGHRLNILRRHLGPESVGGSPVKAHRQAANGIIHRSTRTTALWDRKQRATEPAMKPFWEITEEEVACGGHYLVPANRTTRGRLLLNFLTDGGMP